MALFTKGNAIEFTNILWVIETFRKKQKMANPATIGETLPKTEEVHATLQKYGMETSPEKIAHVRAMVALIVQDPLRISRITENDTIRAQLERAARRIRIGEKAPKPHPKNTLLQKIYADAEKKGEKNKTQDPTERTIEKMRQTIEELKRNPGSRTKEARNYITALQSIANGNGRMTPAATKLKERMTAEETIELKRILERRRRMVSKKAQETRWGIARRMDRLTDLQEKQEEERRRSAEFEWNSHRPRRRGRREL